MGKGNTPRSISLSLESDQFRLAAPIKAKVTYRNRSSARMTFREPAKDKDVRLAVLSGEAQEGQVRFGRMIRYMADGKNRLTVEDAEDVSLDPGDEYSFDSDLAGRWPDLFPPGRHRLRIIDYTVEEEGQSSNPVQIVVLYHKKSFPRLLEIAGDDKAESVGREFAARWIARVYPDFKFVASEPTEDQKAENARQIQDAEAWWASHEEDAGVEERIEKINEAALKTPDEETTGATGGPHASSSPSE